MAQGIMESQKQINPIQSCMSTESLGNCHFHNFDERDTKHLKYISKAKTSSTIHKCFNINTLFKGLNIFTYIWSQAPEG